LPNGVTFHDNGNGTATLSGTPASGSGGSFTLTLTANNGVGTAATQSFTLVVNSGGSGATNFAYITGSVTGAYNSFSGATGKTLTVALHQIPGTGHLLVCAATWQSPNATATMSDPNNGTWLAAGAPKAGVGGVAGFSAQVFYVPSSVNASTSVTLTTSVAVLFRSFECAEYAYTGPVAALDGTPQYSVTPASAGTATISGLTTTNTGDLVVASCLAVDTSCATSSGYTLRNDANTYELGSNTFGHNFLGELGQLIEDKIGSPGAQTASFATGTSGDSVILGLLAF
jgi:hypothetical protein